MFADGHAERTDDSDVQCMRRISIAPVPGRRPQAVAQVARVGRRNLRHHQTSDRIRRCRRQTVINIKFDVVLSLS